MKRYMVVVGFTLSSIACASTPIESQEHQQSSKTPVNSDGPEQQLGDFFNDFRIHLIDGDWLAMSHQTRFPLSVRGELDDSPTVQIPRERFSDFMNALSKEPIYVNQHNDIVETSLQKLSASTSPMRDDESTADWHGIKFQKTNGQWILIGVITYDHVVESFLE